LLLKRCGHCIFSKVIIVNIVIIVSLRIGNIVSIVNMFILESKRGWLGVVLIVALY
jgi:hypothetical protein